MVLSLGNVRRSIFGVTTEVMDGLWSEFTVPETEARRRLRESSSTFTDGYNIALEFGLSQTLIAKLQAFSLDLRGFVYEGAGMGLAMIDYTTPGKQYRLQSFIDDNPNYASLAHIGAGVAIAVLGRDIEKSLSKMAPIERWWAIDGFGFYYGLFKWKRHIEKQIFPKQLTHYARRAFNQGLGRSIWFIFGGDVKRIFEKIQFFPESRHADLWSGIGLASTYTSGVGEETLRNLKTASGAYASYLAIGSAFAANARYLANNILNHTNVASSILCGMSAEETAKMTIEVEEGLSIDTNEKVFVEKPIYETYRERIRTQLIKNAVPA